jgi:hypothetical protein
MVQMSNQEYQQFEFELNNPIKANIWKSLLSIKSGIISNRISARKCDVRIVTDLKIIKSFLNICHLQCYTYANVSYGLYYNNELVSLMTFSRSRFNKQYQWELIRFCSQLNTVVIGGASRLLCRFEKDNNPVSLISYANLRFSEGKLYNVLGFNYEGKSRPNYFYIKDSIVYSRIKFQKHKLSKLLTVFNPELTEYQNMMNNGYTKVIDKGNLIFTKRYT